MSKQNHVQAARVAYYVLPIGALLVAFLEPAALAPVPWWRHRSTDHQSTDRRRRP